MEEILSILAGILSSLSLSGIAEGLAASAIWSTGVAIAGKLGKENLSKLFQKSLQDVVDRSSEGYDQLRRERTKQIVKALRSGKPDEIIRRYAKPDTLDEFTTDIFVNEISRELAQLMHDEVGFPQDDLESYLRDAMRDFQDALIRRVAGEQELCNIVKLNLGSKALATLKSIGKGIEAISKRTTTAFPSYTVLPVSDFRELEKILRYNPPKTSLHKYVTRKETEFDPSGKKILIIGTPGSGKTTTIMRLFKRLSEGKIVAIHRSFSSRDIEDLINHIPIDEPVVLVWDDLHEVSEPSLVPNVINKLEEIPTRFTMMLAVRSTEYETLHKQISEHFWETFDEKRMVDLDVPQILHLIEICKLQLNVTMDENVTTRLSLRIHSTDPTPMYAVSAMLLFQGRTMHEEDIHTIPSRTLSIWTKLFVRLDGNAPHAANVLRSLKLLESASVPPMHQIVLQIYEHLFRGDAGQFQSAIARLGDMGWIRTADEFYLCHDLQLEAVDIPDQWYGALGLLPGRLTLSDPMKAATLHNLGVIAADRGRYEDAAPLYNASLEIERKLGDQSGVATTLHQLAMIEGRRGNYEEARNLYDQSLTIKRKLGDQSGIATTLGQLAIMEYSKGNYEEAKKLYDEVKATFEKLGDQSRIATTLHQLAMIEQDKGNYEEARNLYDQSLTIKRKLGDQSGVAKTLHQLAMIEQDKGNYEEAKKLYNESLEIERKLGDQSGIAATLGQLGRMAEEDGNFELAEKHYQQALQIFEKLGEKPYVELAKKDLERIRQRKHLS